jgi:hypothetical protein
MKNMMKPCLEPVKRTMSAERGIYTTEEYVKYPEEDC